MRGTAQSNTLQFLARAQRPDGGFAGCTSKAIAPFQAVESLPTIFFTALIAEALSTVSEARDICAKASAYLRKHRQVTGTWNYWERSAAQAQATPYPDDIDDTACALRALVACEPQAVGAAMWADFARALLAAERAPGGPYYTWLISEREPRNECDVVVNANVAGTLATQGARVRATEAFIDTAIATGSIGSVYYVGSIPALYFLAPWYRGEQLPKLRQLVRNELRKTTHAPLAQAMLLAAATALRIRSSRLGYIARQLEQIGRLSEWTPEALYVHTKTPTNSTYAGCAALTAAIALSALQRYHALPSNQKNHPLPRHGVAALRPDSPVPRSDLRQAYHASFRHLVLHDRTRQITGIATSVARAYGVTLDAETERHLNLASANGWIAYTIYDDILDGDGQPNRLSVANLSLRQTVAHFRAALPEHAPFADMVQRTLDTVDAVNQWEIVHARAATDGKAVSSIVLPDYGSFDQLADKSWGHMLAASAVVLAQRRPDETAQLRCLQRFFRHFLIARQLNDDAHDWEQDLAAGRLSAAVSLLLADAGAPSTVTLATDLPNLRLLFWEQTIVAVASSIQNHVRLARQALRRCALADPVELAAWLDPLEAAATQALAERAETQAFISAYLQTATD